MGNRPVLGRPGEVTAQRLVVILSSYFHCLYTYGLLAISTSMEHQSTKPASKTLSLLPSLSFSNCIHLRIHPSRKYTMYSRVLTFLSSCLLYIRVLHFEESSHAQHLANSVLPLLPLFIPRLGTKILPYGLIL